MKAPGYWMHETGGDLRPAIEAYLTSEPMTQRQIDLMRDYLKQWIMGPWHPTISLDALRMNVNWLYSREAIDKWLEAAEMEGIDPL